MSQSANPAGRNPRRHPRYDFRARSHEDAHANGDVRPAAIPEHPMIPRGAAALINTPAALCELIGQLRSAGSFAYDSEFIGELSFHPKLCLIQVATAQRVALIDTLTGLNLAEFWALIADAAVEKIVHSGQQDLEPVFRHLDRPPANIIDTQIAAAFAGLAYPAGLSKLVRELIGVSLGKGFTFTHWDQRPLSNVQMRYAADDVRYLPAVRQAIGQRIEPLGYAAWAAEECASLTDPSLYRIDPETAHLKLRGAGALAPKNLSALRELVVWRHDAARRYDSPPRSYVKDEILIDLAKSAPQQLEGLRRIKHLPRPVEEAEGAKIIDAIARGLSAPQTDCPVANHLEENPSERFAGDALWAAVQVWCHGHSIDPNVVTSRQELMRHYRELRAGSESDSRLCRGWRKQFIGEALSRFMAGKESVVLSWSDAALRAHSTRPA